MLISKSRVEIIFMMKMMICEERERGASEMNLIEIDFNLFGINAGAIHKILIRNKSNLITWLSWQSGDFDFVRSILENLIFIFASP